MALSGDPFLGLHVGEDIRPVHYGVLGYVLMSCETVQQVMALHQRWHQLVATGQRVVYEVLVDRVDLRIELDFALDRVPRSAVDCHIAHIVTFARWLVGRHADPVEVRLPHAEPAASGEYRRLFRCPVRFASGEIAVSFARDYLNLRLPQGDPELRHQMEARAGRKAAELGLGEDELVDSLKAYISEMLADHVPAIDEAAHHLGSSARTLQRQLSERATTFSGLVGNVRRDTALQYIANHELTLVDIDFLLGFSEQSAFHRAFKRWTGQTPQAFRDRLPG